MNQQQHSIWKSLKHVNIWNHFKAFEANQEEKIKRYNIHRGNLGMNKIQNKLSLITSSWNPNKVLKTKASHKTVSQSNKYKCH